jgi:hypothetical protein
LPVLTTELRNNGGASFIVHEPHIVVQYVTNDGTKGQEKRVASL